jgi:hypothetical protein
MPDDPRVRLALLARALRRARTGAQKMDELLFGAEAVNSTASFERGPATWETLRAEARPCFVLSTGRTGTMSLASVLAASPAIDAHHEPEPRLIAASYLAWTGAEDDTFWREALAVARDRLVFGAHKRGKVYFEGSNRMTLVARHLAALYPGARFLLICRRPEGFIRSALRRGYYCGHPWDHARMRPRPTDEAAESWGELAPEQRCAWLWRTTHEEALDFLADLPAERKDVLRAEDLFAGDLERLTALFGFLGVEPPTERRLKAALARRLNQQQGEFPWGREPAWTEAERVAQLDELRPLVGRLGYGDAS